jgi:hypothetical protein
MRLVFMLWEALSFPWTACGGLSGVARAPRTRSRGIREMRDRKAGEGRSCQ